LKGLTLAFLFLLLNFNIFSQGNTGGEPVKVNGKVFNKASMEPVPYVHIIDITRHAAVTANENAEYSFVVNRFDTLIFSAVGFEDKMVTLSDSIVKKVYYINIRLLPRAYVMGEVDIYANDPMKGFRKDTARTTKYYFSSGAGGKAAVAYKNYPGGTGYITAFANMFNRHYQQEKKLGKIIAKESGDLTLQNRKDSIKMVIDSRYNHFVVNRVTGLTSIQLNEFVRDYRPTDLFILNSSDYDLALQIANSFYDYQKKHGMDVNPDEILRRAIFRK
jgi:hypothetical protein